MTNYSEGYDPINEADEEERQINNELIEDEYREEMRAANFTDEEIDEQLRELKKSQ